MVRSKGFLAGCIVAVGCLVAGCAGGGNDDVDLDDPYAVEFELAISESDSEFVKSILADHVVTAAEYGESLDRYGACLEEAGLHPMREESLAGFASYLRIELPADEYESESARLCEAKWVGGIDGLYVGLNMNPQNVSLWDLTAECLVETGVAPSGTTGADIEEVIGKAGNRYTADGDEERLVAGPEDPNAKLPGGVGWDDPRLSPCLVNPLNPQEG